MTVNAQNYLISFSGSGETFNITNVRVENLMSGKSLMLDGADILRLTGITGINENELCQSVGLKIYPNPMSYYSILEVNPPAEGNALLTIHDLTGRQINKYYGYLEKSKQQFRISGLKKGLYLISIKGNSYQYTGKLLCTENSTAEAVFVNISNHNQSAEKEEQAGTIKGTKNIIEMEYSDGDRLKFTGISGIYSTVITDIPTSSKTINFEFTACTDGDNNNYPVIRLGTQIWMAENLKTTRYNDGTAISLCENNSEWIVLTTPAYCWYENNKIGMGDIYGGLYNWYSINETTNGNKNLCPSGWHIPDDEEWKQLEVYLGMSRTDADKLEWRGTNEGGEIKENGESHWNNPNTGADNSSGFTALGSGYRRWSDGSFTGNGIYNLYWSNTEYDITYAWKRTLNYIHPEIYRYFNPKAGGFSLRCVLNNKE